MLPGKTAGKQGKFGEFISLAKSYFLGVGCVCVWGGGGGGLEPGVLLACVSEPEF